MLPPATAAGLNTLGHDDVAVAEAGFTGSDNAVIYEAAVEQQRVVVTENFADFASIIKHRLAAGEPVTAVVFVRKHQHPRAGSRSRTPPAPMGRRQPEALSGRPLALTRRFHRSDFVATPESDIDSTYPIPPPVPGWSPLAQSGGAFAMSGPAGRRRGTRRRGEGCGDDGRHQRGEAAGTFG